VHNVPMKTEKLLSTQKVAEQIGLTADSIRKYCNGGRIAGAYQDDTGKWWIPAQSIAKGIQKNKPGRKRKEKTQ